MMKQSVPHSQPLTLRSNFSWTFAGNVIYAACQWGMLVVLTKLGNPEMVGEFALGFAVTAPVIIFTNLSLRSVQATDAKYEYNFSDYLGLRIVSSGLALLTIAFIIHLVNYSWETALVVFLVGVAKVIESISDVYYGLLQQHERMDRVAVSLMIKGPLSLLLLSIGVYSSGSIVWGTAGLVVAWAIVLVSYDIPNGTRLLHHVSPASTTQQNPLRLEAVLQFRGRMTVLGRLLWLTLPLGFVAMLHTLSISIPRYLIEGYLGHHDLGIFSALAYLIVAGNIVVGALSNSASPRLAQYYVAGDRIAFQTLLLKLTGLGALLGGTAIVVALVAGKQLLTILYQPEYAQHTGLLVQLMIAAAISYTFYFLADAMIASRYFRIQVPMYVLVNVISAIACFWLIPLFGLQGAAIALIITASCQSILSLGVISYALYRLHKISLQNKQHYLARF
jgi:O-antigen/teichoic acid export membrane protein